MCLISREPLPKKAEEDIVCYKILAEDLLSPWQKYPFELDKVFTAEDPRLDVSKAFNYYMIEDGYFHSYISLNIAIYKIESLKRYSNNLKLFKAIIPKGSNYYIGVHSDCCSTSIKIIEECML